MVAESKRWSMLDESMKVSRMVDRSLQFEESNPVTNAGKRGWVYRAIKNVRFWEADVYWGKKKVNWKPLEIRKPFLISGKARESKIRIHSCAYVHILIVRDLQSGEKMYSRRRQEKSRPLKGIQKRTAPTTSS